MQPLQAVRVLRQLGRQNRAGLGYVNTAGTVRLYLHPEDLDSRQRSHTGSGRAPLLHIMPGVTSVQRQMHNTMPELTHWTEDTARQALIRQGPGSDARQGL